LCGVKYIEFWEWETAGIAPDSSKHGAEQSESQEAENKLVREALISAYDKNIATKLKDELCSLEVNNYEVIRDASTSKCSNFSMKNIHRHMLEMLIWLDKSYWSEIDLLPNRCRKSHKTRAMVHKLVASIQSAVAKRAEGEKVWSLQ